MITSIERRTCPLEIRSELDGVIRMGGLGIPFERVSLNLGGFHEVITRGAVNTQIVARSNPAALYGHDPNKPLGKAKAGTLRFWEDSDGIWYEFDLPLEISYARDLLVSVKRGDISESSFGFRLDFGTEQGAPTDWTGEHDGLPLRRINRIAEVFDFSPVVFPAYGNNTSVGLRELQSRTGNQTQGFTPYYKGINFVNVNRIKWTTGS